MIHVLLAAISRSIVLFTRTFFASFAFMGIAYAALSNSSLPPQTYYQEGYIIYYQRNYSDANKACVSVASQHNTWVASQSNLPPSQNILWQNPRAGSNPPYGFGCFVDFLYLANYGQYHAGDVQPNQFQQNYVQSGLTCPGGYVLHQYTNVTPSYYSCDVVAGTSTTATQWWRECDTCTVAGDPVMVGTGLEIIEETDYRGTDTSGLRFTRYYRSWPGVQGLIADRLGYKWSDTYRRSVSVLAATTNAPSVATVTRPEGRAELFALSNGVWVADADIADQLQQFKDGSGNTTGWQFTNAADDSTEAFDATGKLVSIRARNGVTQTLSYSTTATPTSIAPGPGYVIGVSDSFGRTLSFTYDNQLRIASMTDPAGNQTQYRYDSNNNLQTVTFPDTRVRTYVYNEQAYTQNTNLPTALTGIVDENNNRFAIIQYYSSGRVMQTQHAGGAELTTFTYNTGSTTVTDARSTSRAYSFQKLYGTTKTTGVSQGGGANASSLSAAVSYDINGNIANRTDFNGNVTNYVYDLTRNLETSRTEAYGTAQARTITTQWHSTYRLPTLITEPGRTTAFSYDVNGNLLSKTITDTALNKSRTWTYTYNSLGQVLTADGPRTDVSDVTTYSYYSSASNTSGSVHSIGDLATITNALGQVTSITNYDLNGRPLAIVDANGITTTLSYDTRGRLLTRTVNNTQTTTYQYDSVGQLIKVTLPDSSYLSYTFDTAHRLTDITDNAGNKIHYTLDAMGNRTQEDTKDPSNAIAKTRSRVFDALNRLQKDIGGTSPTTQITQYGYDNNGNLKTITDALNHITTNGYDALNRLITVKDPANNTATTAYNALDQVTSVTDPRSLVTQYTNDALGNVTQVQSPDTGTTQNTVDAAGNVTQQTDARSIVANYTFDALNRVTSIIYPAHTAENVSFSYDSTTNGNKGIGNVTGYSNDGGATVWVYDSYGNVVTQTEMIGSQFYLTGFQYDSANRLGQITYADGRIVAYSHDALGQITQVQMQDDANSPLTTVVSGVAYKPLGPISSLTFGNGVTSTFQYDADYRASRITTTSTPYWDFVYSRDAAGNITGMADQVGSYSRTFGYDNLDRLTSDTNNAGSWTYAMDANGNRTQRQITLSGTTTTQALSYATTSNKLTGIDGNSATLDAAGNLTVLGIKGYGYNNADRLINYSESGTTKATFGYSAIGKRTWKQGTLLTHYRYGLDGKLLSTKTYNSDGSANQEMDYIWLADMPIAQVVSTYTSGSVSSRRTTYIHTDHLNTPRAMTDSTKNIVWRWDGDAYGATAPNNNPDGDGTTDNLALRYAGQVYDLEMNASDNGARTFDPDKGGNYSLQADPLGLAGGSWSLRGYSRQNPLRFTDPSGLQTTADTWCRQNPAACADVFGGGSADGGASATANAAGAAATIGSKVGDTGYSGKAANDSSYSEKKNCPPDDNQWCRRQEERLNKNRDVIVKAWRNSTKLIDQKAYSRVRKTFNIEVGIHNSICPQNRVEPLP